VVAFVHISYLIPGESRSPPRNSPPFMEPEGSSPCSQEPATCACLQPDESNPHAPAFFRRSILMFLTHQRPALPSGFFSSGIATGVLYAFIISLIRAACPAHPRFDHLYFLWRLQVMEILTMQLFPGLYHFIKCPTSYFKQFYILGLYCNYLRHLLTCCFSNLKLNV
jgi:hypothetical protein